MSKNCLYCGEPLSFGRRLLMKNLHPRCREEQKEYLSSYEQTILHTSSDLRIDDNTADRLREIVELAKPQDKELHEINTRTYGQIAEQLAEDGELAQDERDHLAQLQALLSLTDQEAESRTLDRIRQLTSIREGNLPVVSTSVRLHKGEVAHYVGTGTWKHLKTRRKRVPGTGGRSVRIAKGVSVKVGKTSGYTKEWEEFQTVDQGKIVVTSKRFLFAGGKKNLNLKHQRILDLECYSDGVKMQRGTVNPTYLFMDDPVLFYAVLSAAIDASTA